MERLINKILEHRTKDLDIYKHNGSTWLIFTDERKWVIELTSSGTLWYNYYFFKKCFGYLSLDVVENQHYITKWVENTVINRVNPVLTLSKDNTNYVEETIQNGVKHTSHFHWNNDSSVEETIQNGVKETIIGHLEIQPLVEETIQNGVKETRGLEEWVNNEEIVNKTIQNGVKNTKNSLDEMPDTVEDIIQSGVKETHRQKFNLNGLVDDIIDNGVKETICGVLQILNPMDFESEFAEMKRMNEVNIVLEGGIKETKTPGDGDLLETKKWLNEHNAHSVPNMIDEIFDNGIKITQSGILFDESKVDAVINEGVKEIRTKELSESQVNRIIKNGIKEVQPLPAQDGNRDWGLYYQGQEDRTKPHTEYVKDVIKDSIPMFKLVYNPNDFSPNRIEEDLREKVDKVLVDGIKETNWRRVDNFPEFEERVIKGGTKI